MGRRFVNTMETVEAWPEPVAAIDGDDNAYEFDGADLEGALMELRFGIQFNRLQMRTAGSWNPAGTGDMRVCIYQSEDGSITQTMAKIFDELVAGGDPGGSSTTFEITPTGQPPTLQPGFYIIGLGLDTGGGSTLNPWMNSRVVDSVNIDTTGGIGMPATFTSLGAGSSATPPATIDPTVLTGGGLDDVIVVHKFRKV